MPPVTIQQAFDLALQHHRTGRLAEAENVYRQILAIDPRHADSLHLLGVVARQSDRSEIAVELILKAIALVPTVPAYHSNLGVTYRNLGRLDEAIAAYRTALQLNPDYAKGLNNLGDALREQGRVAEAIAACQRALQIEPDFAEAHCTLGAALAAQGRFDEAVAAHRRALQLKPDYPEGCNNLGNALTDQGQLGEAIAAYRRALEIRPDYADAHSNLANALKDHGHAGEAIAAYRRALEIKPDYVQAHSNLLLVLHYAASGDIAATFREHCRWDDIHAGPLAKFIGPHGNDRDPARRLRIGFVSPDFREHSVAFFFESLLANHDAAHAEVFCYSGVRRADAVTARMRECAAHWRDISALSDAQAADLIRGDRIDILVDLAGHTANNRLLIFARKPAPVQVACLGYCDTTGMRAMDYRLTDALADPPGTTEHLHTERLVRVPDCAWCFCPSEKSPPVAPPPVARSGHITFGCFNARPKITDAVLALWSQILREVPGSRLLLKNLGFSDPSEQQRARAFLEKSGVSPDRFDLVGRVANLPAHLAFYDRVDIALDTFPYNGTTTTCEALWLGVPVITLAGGTHASRVGVSLLTNVGLPELIASSPEEYAAIAARLASDAPRLANLRASLREKIKASPLMDAPRFARNVEHAFREMWRAWCANPATEIQ